MDEIYVVVAGLYLVPVFALLATWKKPLAAARRRILLTEGVGLILLVRQGVQGLRKRARLARFHAIVGPGKDGGEP